MTDRTTLRTGQFIYFDSARSGSTQIWRMKADGSEAEQVTADDSNINSSPHVSPDGKTVAFLSQPVSEGSLGIGDASIKVFGVHDGFVRTVTNFQGDRGSFQMYGWGDNNHVAFVSYQVLPEAPVAQAQALQGPMTFPVAAHRGPAFQLPAAQQVASR